MGSRTLLTGLGAGALTMYLLDPDRGRRRRAVLRDKVVSARYTLDDAVEMTRRDLGHRARGVVARIQSRFSRDEVADEVLAERVRSRLGGLVGHARSVDVSVANGRVSLRGPVLAHEADRLLQRAAWVRGVRAVVDELDRRANAGGEPGLQGRPAMPLAGERMEWMQAHWSPSARLAAGAAGAAMAMFGLARVGIIGPVASVAGVALLLRAAFNLELRRLFGVGADRHAVVVQKTIEVAAPIEEVFELWSRYESFPRFMAHVLEVQRIDDKRSRWTVSGPGGVPIQWETVETDRRPPERIAWRTEPRSGDILEHEGRVRFARSPSGGTRIHLQMSYTPIGGALGHGMATLFGADPEQAMKEDLVRFKSLLEDGKTTVRSRIVRREDIA